MTLPNRSPEDYHGIITRERKHLCADEPAFPSDTHAKVCAARERFCEAAFALYNELNALNVKDPDECADSFCGYAYALATDLVPREIWLELKECADGG